MNRGKFIQQVIHSPTLEYVKPHLEAAANQMIAEGGGRVSRKDVPKAVSWAVVIADQVKAAQPEPAEKMFKLQPGPDDLIRQDQLVQILALRVKRTREELFGDDSAPFVSRMDPELARYMAEAWIKSVARKEDPYKDPLFGLCACGKVGVFLTESRRRLTPVRYLEYQSPTDSGEITVKRVPVAGVRPFRTSDLASLENQSRWLAKATGFSMPALVTWILTDIQPTLDPVAMGLFWHRSPFPEVPERYWAKVQVNSFQVTAAQWTGLRRQLRQHLGITKSKPLSDPDQKLLRIVDSLGGVPKKHGEKRSFWERVFREHLEAFPKWQSADAIRKRYGRIRGKLGPMADAVAKAKEDIDETRATLDHVKQIREKGSPA